MFRMIGLAIAIVFVISVFDKDKPSTSSTTTTATVASSGPTNLVDVMSKKDIEGFREGVVGLGAYCPEVIHLYSKTPKKSEKSRFKAYCGVNGQARSNLIYIVTENFNGSWAIERGGLLD